MSDPILTALFYGIDFGPSPSEHITNLPLGEDPDTGCTLESPDGSDHRILYVTEHMVRLTDDGPTPRPITTPTEACQTRDGSDARLKRFCDERGIPHHTPGLLVIKRVSDRA